MSECVTWLRRPATHLNGLSRRGTVLKVCCLRHSAGQLANGADTSGTCITYVNFSRMTEADPGVADNMRARAAQCRRLAEAITDKRAAAVLLKMAEEVEADILRLEGDVPNPIPPTAA